MELVIKAIILGIVQGLTEFLPISSTGHMIIVDAYLKLPEDFREAFLVIVQLGSILSVLVYFWRRLFPAGVLKSKVERLKYLFFWSKIIAGVVPALLAGYFFGEKIQSFLYNPATVAIALFVGGIVLIGLERVKRSARYDSVFMLPYSKALGIGIAQCIAMIPGVSRSAATIIGGLCLGTSRSLAVEYSFFLAIPTMFLASAYSLLKKGARLTGEQWLATGAGFVTAFIVALAVIAFLMSYIRKKDFQAFGWYRIGLAAVLAVWLLFIA